MDTFPCLPTMKFTNRDKFLIYAELAKMVKAGFGFDRGADLLIEHASSPVQRRFALGLKKGLEKGETISEAMGKIPLGITDLEISVVQAAESSGSLETGFGYLHDYFHSIWQTQRRIRARLVYPFILLHLAILLPMVPDLFSGTTVADLMQRLGISLLVLYGAVALIWMWASILTVAARKNPGADRFLGTLPLIGKARKLIAWQRFSHVFGMFVRSGQKITTGLETAGNATQSARLIKACSRIAEAIRSGNQLGPSFLREKAFASDFARSIQSAEAAGTLDEDLARWAQFYDQSVENQMEKIGRMIPGILYFSVVIFVGWKIIEFYQGYVQTIMDVINEI